MKRLPLFEEKIIKVLIQKQCESIAKDLSDYYSGEKEPGWMSGLAGISCFFFHFSRFSGNDSYKNMAYGALEKIILSIEQGFSHPSFATGLAGINWMFHYLGDKGFISPDEAKSLDQLHKALDNFAIHQFNKGEYDVLHGALGIFLSSRFHPENKYSEKSSLNSEVIIPLVKNELTRLAVKMDGKSLTWETRNPLKGYKEINFGLAHGIPSVLLNLSLLYRITRDREIITSLIDPGMHFLLQNMVEDPGSGSFFPTRIHDLRAQRPSRLAWCYGDPGVAHAIYQIGENCTRSDWQDTALKILKRSSLRLSQEETGILDACVCHGSAGLALIYYSIGRKTGNRSFLETSRKWIRTTLDFGNNENASAGYLFKDNHDKYLPKYSFLEGISGIGLTLMAVLEGELPGWEKGIMI